LALTQADQVASADDSTRCFAAHSHDRARRPSLQVKRAAPR